MYITKHKYNYRRYLARLSISTIICKLMVYHPSGTIDLLREYLVYSCCQEATFGTELSWGTV